MMKAVEKSLKCISILANTAATIAKHILSDDGGKPQKTREGKYESYNDTSTMG